jgi:hypothetical protein
MASNVGAPRHLDWYLNLVATETYDALAIPTEGDERDRLWATIKAAYPFFADPRRRPSVSYRLSRSAATPHRCNEFAALLSTVSGCGFVAHRLGFCFRTTETVGPGV